MTDPEQITVAPDGRPLEAQPAWRQDFPIDSPQDTYVERRDFVKFLVLTSLAFTVGQFWIGMQNWWRRRAGRPEVMRIAALTAVPVGSVLPFTYPTANDPCLLIRPVANVLLAYGQKCTHLSCAVIPDVAAGVIRCPCHEGRFDLSTGAPTGGPPRRPLTRVSLQLRGDDVYATGVEYRVA